MVSNTIENHILGIWYDVWWCDLCNVKNVVQKYYGGYVQLGIVYFRLLEYLVLDIVYHIMRNGDVILL